MGTTTNFALPYPSGDDMVMAGNDAIQDLAEDLDELLPVSGAATISASSVAAGSLTNVTINFGTTFPRTPKAVIVYITGFVSGSSLALIRGTSSITTTQFLLTWVNASTGSMTFSNMPIRWVAIF